MAGGVGHTHVGSAHTWAELPACMPMLGPAGWQTPEAKASQGCGQVGAASCCSQAGGARSFRKVIPAGSPHSCAECTRDVTGSA